MTLYPLPLLSIINPIILIMHSNFNHNLNNNYTQLCNLPLICIIALNRICNFKILNNLNKYIRLYCQKFKDLKACRATIKIRNNLWIILLFKINSSKMKINLGFIIVVNSPLRFPMILLKHPSRNIILATIYYILPI